MTQNELIGFGAYLVIALAGYFYARYSKHAR